MANYTNEGKKTLLEHAYVENPTRTKFSKVAIATTDSASTLNVDSEELGFKAPITTTTLIEDGSTINEWSTSTDAVLEVEQIINKKGANSFNLYKTGTTESFASTQRTEITSFDIDGSEIWLFVYTQSESFSEITDYQVRLGSNIGSDYYEYTSSITNLSDGWNAVKFSVSDANVVGSPDPTSITGIEVVVNTENASDTISSRSFIFDDVKVVNENDFFKQFVNNFPVVSTTQNEVTSRARIRSTEAVGFNISRAGIYNDDQESKLLNYVEFPAESKSDSDEFNLIWRDRVL